MSEPTEPASAVVGEPIGMVGAGYVGLVTAVSLASLGHHVTVRDIDPDKITALQAGEVPIYEPGLASLLAENAARLSFTLSMADVLRDCRLIFVAVDTPPTHSGDADLSKVMSVLFELAALGAGPEHLVVMKSTVPVGTGRRIRAILRDRGLPALAYVSNPEFLREGTAIADFLQPDRIVIGAFEASAADRVEALYRPLEAPILRTSVASAEMIKYASNAFLATKISFINEIANVCEEVGADVDVVSRGMGMDPRIGPSFLRAGIGFGGSCFPKDVAALKQLAGNSGYHFQLLTSVIEVNELQKRRVINKLKKHLGGLHGKEIALLGLAFKPGTDDMREAASLVLVGRLLAEGALVRGYDPVVRESERLSGVEICVSAEAAVYGADAAILVTEWPELVHLDWVKLQSSMRQPVLIDGRNVLDPESMRRAGYIFEGIGRQLV
ncbi:UDP-glucose/GDP-mannose dehydrogenase family protein [soil metagenome]